MGVSNMYLNKYERSITKIIDLMQYMKGIENCDQDFDLESLKNELRCLECSIPIYGMLYPSKLTLNLLKEDRLVGRSFTVLSHLFSDHYVTGVDHSSFMKSVTFVCRRLGDVVFCNVERYIRPEYTSNVESLLTDLGYNLLDMMSYNTVSLINPAHIAMSGNEIKSALLSNLDTYWILEGDMTLFDWYGCSGETSPSDVEDSTMVEAVCHILSDYLLASFLSLTGVKSTFMNDVSFKARNIFMKHVFNCLSSKFKINRDIITNTNYDIVAINLLNELGTIINLPTNRNQSIIKTISSMIESMQLFLTAYLCLSITVTTPLCGDLSVCNSNTGVLLISSIVSKILIK